MSPIQFLLLCCLLVMCSCRAACNGAEVNIVVKFVGTRNVELIHDINGGQALKFMDVPSFNIFVLGERSRLLMNQETGISGYCRLPTMQVSLRRLIPRTATALVITFLFATIVIFVIDFKRQLKRHPCMLNDGPITLLKSWRRFIYSYGSKPTGTTERREQCRRRPQPPPVARRRCQHLETASQTNDDVTFIRRLQTDTKKPTPMNTKSLRQGCCAFEALSTRDDKSV